MSRSNDRGGPSGQVVRLHASQQRARARRAVGEARHLVTWASDLTMHAEAITAQLAGHGTGTPRARRSAVRGSQGG